MASLPLPCWLRSVVFEEPIPIFWETSSYTPDEPASQDFWTVSYGCPPGNTGFFKKPFGRHIGGGLL
ncbi:MAG: hypothetical protein AMJ79_10970 [Phycisphaerae bacterium SM23_30]|nr:MAG: hypothetical protein AMJ79_10970 [Phycisphaerae bacterium SM23_30]